MNGNIIISSGVGTERPWEDMLHALLSKYLHLAHSGNYGTQVTTPFGIFPEQKQNSKKRD
jgi:hypothetical protein